MQITIGDVDMYGLNGREHHPKAEDKGLRCTVVSFEEMTFEGEDSQEDWYTGLFTVKAPDGRTLEIAEYEVETVHLNVAS